MNKIILSIFFIFILCYLTLAQRPSGLNESIETANSHVVVHYSLGGSSPTTHTYAQDIFNYAENSWSYISGLGYEMPPDDFGQGGNPKYDIYITTSFMRCVPESPSNDPVYTHGYTSYMEISNVPLTIPPFPSLTDEQKLQLNVIHELFHACQYGYSNDELPWFMENTAVWMQDLKYSTYNTLDHYFDIRTSPLSSPQSAITSMSNAYHYCGGLWPRFLKENYNTAIIQKIWDKLGTVVGENILSGINSVLGTGSYGSSLRAALKKYAVWRYFTGDRADNYHFDYNDAKDWPESNVQISYDDNDYPNINGGFSLSGPGGTHFIEFHTFNQFADLNITFDGEDNKEWNAYIIGYKQGVYVQSVELEISLDPSTGYDGSRKISFENVDHIVLVPVLSEWSGASYTYSAQYIPYVPVTFSNKIGGVNQTGSFLTLDGNETIPSGGSRPLSDGSTHDIKTNSERFEPGLIYKHNNWVGDVSQYTFSTQFDVYSNRDQYAEFVDLIPASITNSLTSAPTLADGDIEFHDPWYEDQHGNQPDDFITYDDLPFSPTGKYGETGGGVFKDHFPDAQNPDIPYYSIRASEEETFSAHGEDFTGYFLNWKEEPELSAEFENSNNLETAVVFRQDNAAVKALYKGQLVSANTSAYDYNNQRKLVRTDDGKYYTVYEDGYGIWLAGSQTSNFHGSWNPEILIMNGTAGPEEYFQFKIPSMDFLENMLVIIYEAGHSSWGSNLAFNFIDPASGNQIMYEIDYVDPQYHGLSNPVIAYTYNKIWMVYRTSTTGGLKYKVLENNGTRWIWGISGTLLNTDANSTNPSIGCVKNNSLSKCHVFFSWQQGQTQIDYIKYNNQSGSFVDFKTISTGSGYDHNRYPSLSVASNHNPIISWLGHRNHAPEKMLPKPQDETSGQYRVIVRPMDKNNWQNFYNTGNGVDYTNNNSISYNPTVTYESIIGFSQNEGESAKYIKRFNNTYSVGDLSHPGIQTQISNASDINGVKAMIYKDTGGAPYFLRKSTNNFGSAAKISSEIPISSGKKGVVVKNDIEFVFYAGDMRIDGQNIPFVVLPDTEVVNDLPKLNEAMITESFQLSPYSELMFSSFYYVINIDSTDTLLTANDRVHFKMELVKANTNDVAATFDDIVYTLQNLGKYENKDYIIDCSGITAGNYYFRLVTSVNGPGEYYLTNVQNDQNTLAKKIYRHIDISHFMTPLTYSLKQNYPNPFNPVTKIYFEIPQTEKVSLTVYDIQGRVVGTLVNEQKEEGRYSVQFDGRNLSSGIYFYELVAGKYKKVRKMMLVK